MKKSWALVILLVINTAVIAQQKLYYFMNKDSTAVGVKNHVGEIIARC